MLNACFYKPALLARDAAALEVLSEGRLDLGLGAGYVREEFEAAEIPYPSARERVDYLEHVTAYLREHLPRVPILIAGNGDRLLTVAAVTPTSSASPAPTRAASATHWPNVSSSSGPSPVTGSAIWSSTWRSPRCRPTTPAGPTCR
ncbi:luciferase-like monooxygenase family protein [Mycobacterium xenopi 4042]|uniref:Luciferase-like monooxygenase family protein n=1 Tax=Mycobacterium xenopi 4042 TaxID=1299334 RepID=X8AG42_MYCXE|nr:luciferase-like monooxygenase family protein [Mycobacterium xenopi 4042]